MMWNRSSTWTASETSRASTFGYGFHMSLAAEVADRGLHLVRQRPEEPPQAVLGPVQGDPEQPPGPGVDLVDQRQVAVPPLPLDLVDAQGLDPGQRAVRQPPGHRVVDRAVHGVPGGMEDHRDLLPREPLGPTREGPAISRGLPAFAVTPGDPLDDHATHRAVDAAHGVDEERGDLPERHELEAARREAVVAGPLMVTPGADRAAVAAGLDPDLQGKPACLRCEGRPAVDEALLRGDAVEDSLEEHRVRPRGRGGRDNPSLARGFTRCTTAPPSRPYF